MWNFYFHCRCRRSRADGVMTVVCRAQKIYREKKEQKYSSFFLTIKTCVSVWFTFLCIMLSPIWTFYEYFWFLLSLHNIHVN